ncbi:hypothetical protein BJ944DRAFT_273874 [Cunninghamella echinulata]|nr:hypothetical protein BJ944DRAFT_273874 [Cunninghamella echinulata]
MIALQKTSQMDLYFNANTNYQWPLNEIEENELTNITQTSFLSTTTHEPNESYLSIKPGFRRACSGYRCETCRRRFHSAGNLSNHQQLYQH